MKNTMNKMDMINAKGLQHRGESQTKDDIISYWQYWQYVWPSQSVQFQYNMGFILAIYILDNTAGAGLP